MTPEPVDDNRSCWLAEAPSYRPGPALRADLDVDVAIVGGGLTGTSTAWHLSERFPGLRIALLEAASLANGATGRSGGQVLGGINGVEPRDRETALAIRGATGAGIDIVEELAARCSLDAGFARTGCLDVVTGERAADDARCRVELARGWGIDLRWLPASGCSLDGARGAVLDPAAARVNAAALVRGLRDELIGRGVLIYEHSPVRGIEEGPTLELAVGRGGVAVKVTARAVVLATNAYTPSLGYFRSGILPLHSHVVATGPLPEERWQALGWGAYGGFSDDLDRISYGCRTPGGRLLFGGGGNDAYTYRMGGTPVLHESSWPASEAVERRMRGYFPALGNGTATAVAHRWSGPLAITLDRICTMGVGGRARNLYYALGYSGHGLALSALAGRVLTDLYAGEDERWRALPFYRRRLPPMPPEPLRWLGYQLYTRLTGRSPRRR